MNFKKEEPTPTSTPTPTVESITTPAEMARITAVLIEMGDINLDLQTNINDVLGLLKSVSNGDERSALNDVDKSGTFNINDILAALKNITSN